MNQYRVSGHRPVLGHDVGDEFDYEFSPSEEADMLRQGRLEIVPSRYVVIGPHAVHGAQPGDEFEAALTVGEEAGLLDVHIERVAEKGRKKADKAGEKEEG